MIGSDAPSAMSFVKLMINALTCLVKQIKKSAQFAFQGGAIHTSTIAVTKKSHFPKNQKFGSGMFSTIQRVHNAKFQIRQYPQRGTHVRVIPSILRSDIRGYFGKPYCGDSGSCTSSTLCRHLSSLRRQLKSHANNLFPLLPLW